VVIGGFQCAKPVHMPDLRKTRRDRAEKEDVSGETRTQGNPMSVSRVFMVLYKCCYYDYYFQLSAETITYVSNIARNKF